jgi:hypothetical protein
MAHKKLSGWVIRKRLWVALKIANELWYFTQEHPDGYRREYHLFFFGWYKKEGLPVKVFSLTLLWLQIQVGIASKMDAVEF